MLQLPSVAVTVPLVHNIHSSLYAMLVTLMTIYSVDIVALAGFPYKVYVNVSTLQST